jgi:hypothetical protein
MWEDGEAQSPSPLVAMPGECPMFQRSSAEHPDESACGAHECARHVDIPDFFTASLGAFAGE